jgi:hypothetical protein
MATEAPPITFTTAVAEFSDYDGAGGVDLVQFDGITIAKVSAAEARQAKNSGNWNAKVNVVIIDDEPWGELGAPMGKRLIKDVPYTGKRKDGKMNADAGFAEFLRSTGTELEKVHALAGQTMQIGAVLETVVGRTCYVDIAAKEYDGKVTSEIRNFVTKEQYEKQKKLNAHRRDIPARWRHHLGGGAANGATNGAAAPAPSGGGGAADNAASVL